MSNGNIYFDKFDFGNGFGYIYFENKESNRMATVTADMSKSRNVQLMSPFAPTNLTPKLNINPG